MGIGDNGRCYHHALELAAGALVRIFAVNFLRRGEIDIAQHLEGARAALLLRELRVDGQRLLDLRADAHERVHRAHRLLKHHADLAALNGAQLRTRQAQNITPAHEHLAGERDLFALDEAGERHGGDGLAAAALAHQSDDLAVVNGQVDARHGLARGVVKADVKIAYFDHGASPFLQDQFSPRWSPSPIRLTPRISSTMIRPVPRAYHGAEPRMLCDSESI